MGNRESRDESSPLQTDVGSVPTSMSKRRAQSPAGDSSASSSSYGTSHKAIAQCQAEGDAAAAMANMLLDAEKLEEKRVKSSIAELLHSIRSRESSCGDVNIVFSGPICIGLESYCDQFSQWTRFKYVETSSMVEGASGSASTPSDEASRVVASMKNSLDDLDRERSKALSVGFDDPPVGESDEHNLRSPPPLNRAMLVHVADFLRASYLHLLETELAKAGDDRCGRYRVYHQSPADNANAMARASRALGYIDENSMRALELIGGLAWKLSTTRCRPSSTIYVYIHYPDDKYAEAYDAFVEKTRATRRDNPGTSSGSLGPTALERLRVHASLSKSMLDEFYDAHEATEKYCTVVMDCEERILLSKLHGLVICREVLAFIDALQRAELWGGEGKDARRMAYFASHQWKVHRKRHIPYKVAPIGSVDLKREARAFTQGSSPLPLTPSPSLAHGQARAGARAPSASVLVSPDRSASTSPERNDLTVGKPPRPFRVQAIRHSEGVSPRLPGSAEVRSKRERTAYASRSGSDVSSQSASSSSSEDPRRSSSGELSPDRGTSSHDNLSYGREDLSDAEPTSDRAYEGQHSHSRINHPARDAPVVNTYPRTKQNVPRPVVFGPNSTSVFKP